jgi:hypothetical protein
MKKNNLIVKLNGGLGNQMFQWAIARMLQETTCNNVYLDISYFTKKYARPYQLDIFNINPKFVTGRLNKLKTDLIWLLRKKFKNKKLLGYTLYSEKQFHFDETINKINSNTYIEGFFQSELYFKSIENTLRQDFNFMTPLDGENKKLIETLNSQETISVHIRRGDYVQKKRYQDIYATCSLDYYKRAVEHIAKHYDKPTLLIFSDDIEWVKQNLKLDYPAIFVSHNNGLQSYEDMRLMSLCNHNIIANSSFSWWGAWLNKNPDKIVVAPQKWFNDENIIQTDIIPENWIRLEN